MARGGWVYIMANRYRGTIYVGVTSNLAARVHAHKQGAGSDFCARYGLTTLVLAEEYPTMLEAIAREKQLKHWNRDWKVRLVDENNPAWTDLATDCLPSAPHLF